MSEKDRLNYEKELKIILGAICDGIRQEVRFRQRMMLQFPREKANFCLRAERERGMVSIMAFYIRTTGFLVHVENYLDKGDARITPDLAIWLPKKQTDFLLEVKPIDSRKKDIGRDVEKLSKREGNDRYNGMLIYGFEDKGKEYEGLQYKYDKISKLFHDKFGEIGPVHVSLGDIDGSELKSAMVGLWYLKTPFRQSWQHAMATSLVS